MLPREDIKEAVETFAGALLLGAAILSLLVNL
jgi:hypothetical protein